MPAGVLRARSVRSSDGVNAAFVSFILRDWREAETREVMVICASVRSVLGEGNCSGENKLAEGVGLSKALLWLWGEIPQGRDCNPCA